MTTRTAIAAVAAFALLSTTAIAQDAGTAPVTEAEIRAHMAYLASDDLGGRFPGTAGETATAHYIATQLASFGFVGGAGEGSLGQGWYQPVPLIELHAPSGHVRFLDANGAVLPIPDVAVRGPNGTVDLATVPMVYVGHGVTADGRVAADVRGKVALLLLNDRTGENAMTLAQRQAALVAAGAVATLLIPADTIPFAALQRSFTTTRMQLASRASRAQAELVVSGASAAALLRASGLDLAEARTAAAAADYAGQALTSTATIHASGTRREFNSYNVIGKLPGTRAGSGTVMMMGHWDHIGLCRPEGADDRICNGAVDNASGMAVLIEAARRLGAGPRPDRDIMIVGTTAEEQGLLGAYHLAATPPVPLTDIIVNLNVDTVAIAPRGAPMAMVGRGTTPLEAGVDAVARQLGRTIDSDLEGNAFIRRQDGWALTQVGVASIMAGGSFTDMALLQAFLGGDYHGPNDELRDDVPLGGAADDADLHVALARHFGSVTATPR
jgi:Zn-dependent M28 family amino/carboxypeptidase